MPTKKRAKKAAPKKQPGKASLTPMQQRFVQEYFKSNNATESYKKAGYKTTEGAAKSSASRLLTNANVIIYLKELAQKVEDEAIADGTEVLKFFTKVMRGQVADQYSNKPAIADRVKAGERLAKYHGMLDEKVNVSGEVSHTHKGPSVADELIENMFGTGKTTKEVGSLDTDKVS